MVFSLNWSSLPRELLPDQIKRIPILGIDPETVIARNLAGDVVSRFRDDIWDYRAYGQRSPYYFASWWNESELGPMDKLARTLTNEIKLIFWLQQNNNTANGSRSRGKSLALLSLTTLKSIAKMAHGLGITLQEAEQSAKFQVALKTSIAAASVGFKAHDALNGILNDVAHFQNDSNIECIVPRLVPEPSLHDVQSLLKRSKNKKLEEKEQTPLIPTRLFARFIARALEQLNNIEPHLPNLEAFLKAVYADPQLFYNDHNDWRNNVKRVERIYPNHAFSDYSVAERAGVTSAETLRRYELHDLFIALEIDSLRTLGRVITHHQVLCVMLIHAFSGMRYSEVRVMPFEPVIHQAAKGFGDLPVLVSHLKKFESANYSRALTWATSKEGVYAVHIAQQLARLNWFRNRPADEALPDNCPLWISSVLNRENAQGHYALPIAEGLWGTTEWKHTIKSCGLVIEKEDIDELVTFDAFRNWDENPSFSVGSLWPLTSHQFRRSVAVYASRSGMVSLPTLKTQFKHLSATMTAYYGENSSYAQSFLMDEKGDLIENASVLSAFRAEKLFNASLLLHERVIQASDRLKGPKGTEIQLAKDRGKLPIILSSRAEIEKAMKQGRLSYKETPVGGCMFKGVCPNFGIDLVLPCTSNCKDAILTKEKLKTYVENLRFEQEMMSPKSKPYNSIDAEIQYVRERYLESSEETL
ncbi:MAG: hypothetical protein Q7L19_00215 [Pseudohongiella sp.]|nr:hypothetical protein [Pseudohongiella sp.]